MMWLRVIGWGPFRPPWERKREAEAMRRARDIIERIERGGRDDR